MPIVLDGDGAEDDLVGAAHVVLLQGRAVRRRIEVLARVAQVVSQPSPETKSSDQQRKSGKGLRDSARRRGCKRAT